MLSRSMMPFVNPYNSFHANPAAPFHTPFFRANDRCAMECIDISMGRRSSPRAFPTHPTVSSRSTFHCWPDPAASELNKKGRLYPFTKESSSFRHFIHVCVYLRARGATLGISRVIFPSLLQAVGGSIPGAGGCGPGRISLMRVLTSFPTSLASFH